MLLYELKYKTWSMAHYYYFKYTEIQNYSVLMRITLSQIIYIYIFNLILNSALLQMKPYIHISLNYLLIIFEYASI